MLPRARALALAPAVHTFRLADASLEPLVDAEMDPFPLSMDDLRRAGGEASYAGHSHQFFAFGERSPYVPFPARLVSDMFFYGFTS